MKIRFKLCSFFMRENQTKKYIYYSIPIEKLYLKIGICLIDYRLGGGKIIADK